MEVEVEEGLDLASHRRHAVQIGQIDVRRRRTVRIGADARRIAEVLPLQGIAVRIIGRHSGRDLLPDEGVGPVGAELRGAGGRHVVIRPDRAGIFLRAVRRFHVQARRKVAVEHATILDPPGQVITGRRTEVEAVGQFLVLIDEAILDETQFRLGAQIVRIGGVGDDGIPRRLGRAVIVGGDRSADIGIVRCDHILLDDIVPVDREAEVRGRIQHEADREVLRLLRLQALGADGRLAEAVVLTVAVVIMQRQEAGRRRCGGKARRWQGVGFREGRNAEARRIRYAEGQELDR